jgi:glycosyltransferase involved in cell wall biosynthesis
MNLWLVNPVHPSTPHISAVRAWRFAQALSRMGHRVVVLTATPAGVNPGPIPIAEEHDWREPLVIAAAMFESGPPGSRNPALLRKLQTALKMVRHGGYGSRWADATVAAALGLGDRFRPDAIWATYGKMEAAFVAKRLSRLLGVPWVLDIKDNWEVFVPRLLRGTMARRLRGWRAITANCAFTRDQATRWHGGTPARIVYSGVDEAFFADLVPDAGGRPVANDAFVINLIGSLYYAEKLHALLQGVLNWVCQLTDEERQCIELRYLGSDVGMFERTIQDIGLPIATRSEGYLSIERMAAATRAAQVNMYVTHDGSFHHKLLELLASGPPVLAYPQEGAEARALACEIQGDLIEPVDPQGVEGALTALHRRWQRDDADGVCPAPPLCERFSWDLQARELEEVLAHVA